MYKVRIRECVDGDSRTANRVPSISDFNRANELHRKDVEDMMNEFGREIMQRGRVHDWTKTNEPYRSMFYRDLCNTIEGKMKFEEGTWFKKHCDEERHHLSESCPDDVNLIDVIEMICDCVCAGMARTGEVYDVKISSKILANAVSNTVEMCKNAVEVIE